MSNKNFLSKMDTITTTNDESSSSSWSISDDITIPTVPLFFPIEKTHIIVHEALPSLIVSRTAEFLKYNSIAYTVDDNKFSVKAQTSNHVNFIIRLYSIASSDILVEIQRVSGCAIKFHFTCKNILSAAQGCINITLNESKKASKHVPTLSRPKPKLSRSNKCILPVTSINTQHERIQESLEIVESLLKKDRLDANLLGIESLHMLTNPEVSGYESALVAANVVLGGKGCDTNKEKIQTLVQHWRLCEDDLEEDDVDDFFNRKHYSQMRNHALAILANSLELFSTQGTLSTYVQEDSWLSDTFVSVLIDDLKESSSRPHDGVLSAKCLNLLVRNSDAIREKALDRGAADVLYRTLVFSRCANDTLARESEQVYSALNCCL